MNIKLQKQNFIEESSQRLRKKLSEDKRRVKLQIWKPRFTEDQRSKIVIEGQANVESIETICQREGISISTFNIWTDEFLTNDTFASKVIIKSK